MRVNRTLAELTSAVYFIQGALGLNNVALPLYLRHAGLEIRDMTTLSSIVSLPWLLKPIFAAVSDTFPILGYRRKTYVFFASALSAWGWWCMAALPSFSAMTMVCIFLANAGFAITDVVTDGLIVENSDVHTTQTYQSLSWGSRSLGAIVSGVLGGWITYKFGFRTVFFLTGALPLLSLFISLVFKENRYPKKKIAWAGILQALAKSLAITFKGDLFWFSLLLLLGTVSASFTTPLFFYFRDNLGMKETLLGTIQSLSWIGAVIGCVIYYRFMRKIPLRKTLLIAILMDVASTLLCFLIFNRSSAIALSFVSGIMAYITLLPLMAAAAKLAHGTGIESSLFAILMSVRNAGVVASTFVGGYVHQALGLRMLIFISALASAVGLLVIRKLRTLPV
ncbi:MAG: MFS transporter [Candidatus Omnitrophica bacterium]|nr:MFS transporter [Candidatus Omnitrophota bacterium]